MSRRQPSSVDQRRLYDDLAWTWPIISPPEDYVEETEQFCKAIRQYARIEVNTLLHLGCGGGNNDWSFKKHFSKVTGVDVSQAMLELAKGLNPECAYHVGDLRAVRLRRRFDAVAALDGVNYMLTEEELRAAFATAYAHLKPGGAFLTYAEETLERFEQNKTVGSSHARDNIDITFVQNLHDPDPTDTTYEVTCLYLIRRGGRLEIETDRHLCGLFPLETWVRLLLDVGFQVKQMEYTPPDRDGAYPVFVCVRPGR